jgi:hypothetical protein
LANDVHGLTLIPAMKLPALLFCLAALAASGCVHVKTDPIEVKPIHITVDVNVKVDKALDDFFGDLDKKSTTIQSAAKP